MSSFLTSFTLIRLVFMDSKWEEISPSLAIEIW